MSFSFDNMPVRHKVGIFSVSLLLICCLFYLILWRPQVQRVDLLSTQLAQERQKLKTVEDFTKAHPDSGQYLAALDAKLANVDSLLPNGADVSTFLLQLELMAEQNKVKLGYIKPAAPVNKSGYQEFPLEVMVRGDFANCLAFLQQIETGPRLVSITGLGMQNGKYGLENKIAMVVYGYGSPPTTNKTGTQQ
jgi:Tfp pilus assembly protein PilO